MSPRPAIRLPASRPGLASRPVVQSDSTAMTRLPPLAEHLDQALLLLDERVDAGGLAVEVVGDGALLLQRAAPESGGCLGPSCCTRPSKVRLTPAYEAGTGPCEAAIGAGSAMNRGRTGIGEDLKTR